MASINPAAMAMPTALASPYDGTSPTLGAPISGGIVGGAVPQLTGLGSSGPQVNATNQTAFAPNGDINQSVTNENIYTNKYYNIIVPHSAGLFGGMFGASPYLGGVLGSGNAFIDPKTGVLYVQQETGIIGWLKRLVRGY